MLLFPEVKIKGLSADTSKHEILPQHRALCWNHSSNPEEKAEAKRSPLPIPSPLLGQGQGQAAQSPAGQGRGREPECVTHTSSSKGGWTQEGLSYLGKSSTGECTAGQPWAGTGRGDPQELDTKGIRHAACPGGRAGCQGWLWAQHPAVLPGFGRAG